MLVKERDYVKAYSDSQSNLFFFFLFLSFFVLFDYSVQKSNLG